MANAVGERAGAAIHPKTLARMVLARSGRDLDQPADQASGGRWPTIANPETLMFGAPRPALEIDDLDCSVCRVLKTIDYQPLAALDLQAGLQGKKHKKRHDIVAREVAMTVEFVNELMGWRSSRGPRGIQVPVFRLIGAEEAALLDSSIGGGFHPGQNRIEDWWPSLLQSPQRGGHILPRGVTQLPRDEWAVGVARTWTLKGLGADVTKPIAQVGRNLVRAIKGDLPEHSDDLHEHGEEMDASETAGFEPTLEAIDMPRAKRLDACNRLAGLREVGEEPRDGDSIGLHRRTRAERTGRRGQDGEAPVPQPKRDDAAAAQRSRRAPRRRSARRS